MLNNNKKEFKLKNKKKDNVSSDVTTISNLSKEKLFSMMPCVETPSKEGDPLIKCRISSYNKLFTKASELSDVGVSNPIMYNSRQIIYGAPDTITHALDKLRDGASIRENNFINEIENRLKMIARMNSIELLCSEIDMLIYDAYVQTIHDIIDICTMDDNEVITMLSDNALFSFNKMHSLLEDLLHKISIDQNILNPSLDYRMEHRYSNISSYFESALKENSYPYYYDNSIDNKSKLKYRNLEYVLDNIMASATMLTTQLYQTIYKLAAVAFGYDASVGANELFQADIPLCQAFMAILDGYGYFHIYHDKIVTIYDYANEIFKVYLDTGILKVEDIEGDDDDF